MRAVLNAASETTAWVTVLAAIMQWVPPLVALVGLCWWIMKLVIALPDLLEAGDKLRKRWTKKSPD